MAPRAGEHPGSFGENPGEENELASQMASQVEERLRGVRARIVAADGGVDLPRIVAVTKGFGGAAVAAAMAVGLSDLGENYAAELAAKAHDASAQGLEPRWHFLGNIQRNKVATLARWVRTWEGVARAAEGIEIARHAPGAAVLVQVNTAGDPRRNGCLPDEAPALVSQLRGLGLVVQGLMTVAPLGGPEVARTSFRRLAGLRDQIGLDELSMGMTEDLEVAVREGATIIRVGRALFGPRPT
ncbi:MAG: YggS family pyridoxal phosphate enzyme [Acidimicrobiales bacterium]